MTLPKSLTPGDLLNRKLPDDMTIGECRAFVRTLDIIVVHKLTIEFMFSRTNKPVPDEMLLSLFQKLAKQNRAHISLSNGEGGVLRAQPA